MVDRSMVGHKGFRFYWKYILISLWLVFTLTFAGWWMILGLQQIDQITSLLQEETEQMQRQRRMMIWEGISWMVLLLAGGVALIYLVVQEEKHSRQMRGFFATFSHDVKTSLASLRLQAESLQEDMDKEEKNPVLDRLVSDTVRLQLQLENSLFLADTHARQLFLENIRISEILKSAAAQWPNFKIVIQGDAIIQADERALFSILSNLIQNSIVHGQASQLTFWIKKEGASQVLVEFLDNGKGFMGDKDMLGRLFYRHNSSSGSGVGLYIISQLMRQMQGWMDLSSQSREGFGGRLVFTGHLV